MNLAMRFREKWNNRLRNREFLHDMVKSILVQRQYQKLHFNLDMEWAEIQSRNHAWRHPLEASKMATSLVKSQSMETLDKFLFLKPTYIHIYVHRIYLKYIP